MDAIKKLDNSILLWAGIGPFVIMLTIFVGILKGLATIFYLPLVVVLGIPVCLLWKREGIIAVIALTVVALILGYDNILLGNRLWMIGWTVTLILDVVIMGMAFGEAGSKIRELEKNEKKQAHRIVELDEQIQSEVVHARNEQGKLEEELDNVNSALDESNSVISSHEKLIDLLKDECKQLSENKAKILEEFFGVQKEGTQLRQRVREYDVLLEGEGNEGVKAVMESAAALQDQLRERNLEVEQLRRSISKHEEDQRQVREKYEQLNKENTDIKQKEHKNLDTIEELRGEYQELQSKLELSQFDNVDQDDEKIKEMQELLDSEKGRANLLQVHLCELEERLSEKQQQIETISSSENLDREVSVLERVPLSDRERYIKHIEGVYKQLRGQFNEKNDMLHKTRSSLFSKENELLALKKEREHSHVLSEDLHGRLEQDLVEVSQEEENLEQEMEILEDIIAILSKKLEKFELQKS